MSVYRILATTLAVLTAAVLLVLVAWGYTRREVVAEQLGIAPCCTEDSEACCPDGAPDKDCCPGPAASAADGQEDSDGN